MRIIVAEHVGETRAAIFEGDRAVELHVERWSERRSRAIRGEIYRARVRRIEPQLNGAFLDIGRGPDGFLPFGAAGRPAGFHEGAAIGVQIAREAFQEKGPTLTLHEVDPGDAPEALLTAPPLAERLSGLNDAPIVPAVKAGIDLDGEFEAALEADVPLNGGGRLIIEPVTALTAIDVDAAGRTGGKGNFAFDLNRTAAREAARQIRLRGIGGVVAIDFLPLKKKGDQAALDATLRSAFKNDTAKVDIAPSSRFAIVELARQRLARALHEQMWERFGVESLETRALAALRALEAEGRASRASQLVLEAGPDVYEWLARDPIGWNKAMASRLGARFTLKLSDRLPPRGFAAGRA
ncbi:RNA-binding protein [Glycocaulis albus]|jgi:Ribonuclease G/E|uniref:RNA-binding protein n=1 Tax=Glycocaulis albus TaxID=1382801 RepID=A0ABQ1XF68_9PROT|nr:ribonuclease E/G [Glycocaulis albus]GGG91793.1 RNA-binding protein [Glycocaulis albus]